MDAKEYDNLPDNVKRIVDSWNDNKELYAECSRIQEELTQKGWTCEYGLDGMIYNVKQIDMEKDKQAYIKKGKSLINKFNKYSNLRHEAQRKYDYMKSSGSTEKQQEAQQKKIEKYTKTEQEAEAELMEIGKRLDAEGRGVLESHYGFDDLFDNMLD